MTSILLILQAHTELSPMAHSVPRYSTQYGLGGRRASSGIEPGDGRYSDVRFAGCAYSH